MEWKQVSDIGTTRLRELKAGPETINEYQTAEGRTFFGATIVVTVHDVADGEDAARKVAASLLTQAEAVAEAVGYRDTRATAARQLAADRDDLVKRVVELESFIEGLRCHQQATDTRLRDIGYAAEDVLDG